MGSRTTDSRNRWGHVTDEDYRFAVRQAQRQLEAALSVTAIDTYAREKLDNATRMIADARTQLIAVTGLED